MLKSGSVVLDPKYCDLLIFPFVVCQREEEKEETRLSEEAERSFEQELSQEEEEEEDEPITMSDQQEEAPPPLDVTYQIENENRAPSSTFTVPVLVTAT